MNSIGARLKLRSVLPLLALATLWFGSGCRKQDVAVYETPKEATPAPAPASPHGGSAAGSGADAMANQLPPRPGLKWKSLPEGWTSRGPAGMRVANFSVPGSDGGGADLAAIPLPGTGGSDIDLVNLWRGQLSLEPISEAQLKDHTDETTVAGQSVKLFSIVGSGGSDANAAASQILVAALRKDGFTWFFKLSGDAKTVASNRETLKGFLAGLEFTAPDPSTGGGVDPHAGLPGAPRVGMRPAAGGGTSGDTGQPKVQWQVPAGWKAVPPGQMVHSKWNVSGDGGATAEVAVSVFPGDVGGLVPNLNRWRAKVGLGPAAESELMGLANNTDVEGGKATLVDFAGTDPESSTPLRLVGAVVARDGSSWFYKFTGPPAVIEAHRSDFVKFIQTAKYPRGS